jgi:RNA polymerase sigma-70 factor (ECF subfamily)
MVTTSAPDVAVVVREHGPRVVALLRRTFGPHADVDDLFQQIMLEVVRSLPTFRGASALGTWVHRIALNVVFQEMRRTYRAPTMVDVGELDLPGERDVAADVEAAEAERLLYEALAGLPPHQRIAVVLHDLHGHTLQEVADELATPLQTLASRVQAGRASLATTLGAQLRRRQDRRRKGGA